MPCHCSSPLLAVSRPHPNRRSDRRTLPSHNCSVTSPMNNRRSHPVKRVAAEQSNLSCGSCRAIIVVLRDDRKETSLRRKRDCLYFVILEKINLGKLFPAGRLIAKRPKCRRSSGPLG